MLQEPETFSPYQWHCNFQTKMGYHIFFQYTSLNVTCLFSFHYNNDQSTPVSSKSLRKTEGPSGVILVNNLASKRSIICDHNRQMWDKIIFPKLQKRHLQVYANDSRMITWHCKETKSLPQIWKCRNHVLWLFCTHGSHTFCSYYEDLHGAYKE